VEPVKKFVQWRIELAQKIRINQYKTASSYLYILTLNDLA